MRDITLLLEKLQEMRDRRERSTNWRENAEFAAHAQRNLNALAIRCGDGDEHDLALALVTANAANAALHEVITLQRHQGKSWTDIGRGLGMSAQGAEQRHARYLRSRTA